MALLFLTNLAAYSATSVDAAGLTAGTASGYSTNDFIQGPRSTRHRTTDSSSEIGRGYSFAADITCNYIFVSRADWLLTKNGTRLRPRDKNSGGTWGYVAGVDYNPLTTAHLEGVNGQDLCFAVSPSNLRGIGISTASVSGTQATQVSKFWGCSSFTFDLEPAFQMNWEPVPEYTFVTPLDGTMPYEIERRFSLTFAGARRAKVTEFRALPNIFKWPMILYDSTGDLWNHKIEHVIIEGYEETVLQNNIHVVSLSCARLKHYD